MTLLPLAFTRKHLTALTCLSSTSANLLLYTSGRGSSDRRDRCLPWGEAPGEAGLPSPASPDRSSVVEVLLLPTLWVAVAAVADAPLCAMAAVDDSGMPMPFVAVHSQITDLLWLAALALAPISSDWQLPGQDIDGTWEIDNDSEDGFQEGNSKKKAFN